MNKIWEFFKGKKTVIGGLIVLAVKGITVFFPDLLTPDQITYLASIGEMMLGVGIIHKGVNSSKTTRIKIKNSFNKKQR